MVFKLHWTLSFCRNFYLWIFFDDCQKIHFSAKLPLQFFNTQFIDSFCLYCIWSLYLSFFHHIILHKFALKTFLMCLFDNLGRVKPPLIHLFFYYSYQVNDSKKILGWKIDTIYIREWLIILKTKDFFLFLFCHLFHTFLHSIVTPIYHFSFLVNNVEQWERHNIICKQ